MNPNLVRNMRGFPPLIGVFPSSIVEFGRADRFPSVGSITSHCFASTSGVANVQDKIKHNGQKGRSNYKKVHKNTKTQSDTSK